jgi:hypothetical protein
MAKHETKGLNCNRNRQDSEIPHGFYCFVNVKNEFLLSNRAFAVSFSFSP